MDPFSQGVLGAAFSQSKASKLDFRWATLVGILSGMAPDLDVLIRSDLNPMVSWQYHRHFTHSLVFVPVGAFLCALFFKAILRRKSFKRIYLYSFFGVLSHALLDCCTSYGTQWFWPFSNMRVAWNNVSIIDPLWTLPLFFFVCFAFFKRSRKIVLIGLSYALLYLLLGYGQGMRARSAVEALAKQRGHGVERLHVGPSFGNLVLWRGMYENDGKYYVDAYHLLGEPVVIQGESILKVDPSSLKQELGSDSQQWRDFEIFSWFAMDFVGVHPDLENVLVDVRYSTLPNSSSALWGVAFSSGDLESHLQRLNLTPRNTEDLRDFWLMLKAPEQFLR